MAWMRARRSRESMRSAGGACRTGSVWVLLSVITTASLAAGACALWLPDRVPSVLARAGEVTVASVNTQRYDGTRGVTVIPRLAPAYELVVNAAGTVTEDLAAEGLESGRAALRVNGRAVIALNTATPLYRDLALGDKGDDVRALNAELARLGLGGDPESSVMTAATSVAVGELLSRNGIAANERVLRVADTLWIPRTHVEPQTWTAGVSTRVAPGMKIGEVSGGVTALAIKGDAALDRDRTLTVMGESVTIPAGQSGTDDAEFCRRVSQSDEFRAKSRGGGDLASGFGASVRLASPVQVLRVPAGAVFGVRDGRGCIAVDGLSVAVDVVGADLGVSLVTAEDGSVPSEVSLGSAIAGLPCT